MCTIVVKKLESGWVLGKTRDPVPWMRWDDEIKLFDTPADGVRKWIVQNPNPNEDGYYGGMNDLGVAFIATFVPVTENQISYIRRPYVRLILEAVTANEGIEIIKAFNPRIGGNMFIADENECFGIEGVPQGYYVESVKKQAVKTNHFLHLPYKNLQIKDPWYQAWTTKRYERASELIETVSKVEDIKTLLKDRKGAEEKAAICNMKTEVECFTHSAFVFDTKNRVVHYAQGNPTEVPFKEYRFNKV